MKTICFGAASAAALIIAAQAVSASRELSGRSIPDFRGPWMSTHERKFIPSSTGPMPVMDDPAHPHVTRGVGSDGRDTDTTAWVGDWRNPNLTPWAAAAVKKAGDDDMAGHGIPTAESTCWPAGVPAIMNFFEPVFFLQTPKEVTILYQRGPNVRHVYLNRPHSPNPKPSWYGESVGHYEGNTLVVDTIGFNDKTALDSYHTPHSEGLHVVERYHLIGGASEPDRPAQGDAFVFTGNTLQVDFMVEDSKAFKRPWSAVANYRHVNRQVLEESICSENNSDLVTGKIFPIPTAAKPDF